MRILMTTRGSSGHVLPLAPFGQAAVGAGHEVLVAAQRRHAGNVARTGLPCTPVPDPPPEQWMPLMGEFTRLSIDGANARMVGEFFARIDTEAALPALEAIVDDFAPDLVIRESWEFASTLVAEPRRSSATAATARPSARSGTACRSWSCRCSASTSGPTPARCSAAAPGSG